MPTLTIDNQPVTVPEGATVLDAARRLGIDIPTLCHAEGLPPQNSCLLCVVKVDGGPRLRPACSLPAAEGMAIESETGEVRGVRRTGIELLLSDHAGDCTAPCQNNCPAHMDVPRMMRQVLAGDLAGAIDTVKRDIPLPAVLGRVCPAPCEGGCRRKPHDAPVAVCLLKRYVADVDLASPSPWLPRRSPDTGKRVAVIGAGPTGLAAAYYLQLDGHACTVFDDRDQPGGMLRYRIDPDRLPRDVLDAEIDVIRRLGVAFRLRCRLGGQLTLDAARRDFDAVLLAIGAGEDDDDRRDLGVRLTRRGVAVHPQSFATDLDGVFAAGGAVKRTRLAVRSVAEGKVAARSITRYLAGEDPAAVEVSFDLSMGRLDEQELAAFMLDAADDQRLTPEGGLGRGYTDDEARQEAGRCMQCDCGAAEGCGVRRLASDLGADLKRYRGTRRPYARPERHGLVAFEPAKCIDCGLCVAVSAGEPGGGATFVGRGYDMRLAGPFGATVVDSLGAAAGEAARLCPTGALRASAGAVVALTVRDSEGSPR